MNPLERRYRSKFTPDGADFTFVQWEQEVRFTRAEVEEILAEWRRLWLSPVLWTGWLMVGVALPIVLGMRGYQAGAITLAGVSALALVVVLVHGERRANDWAEQRAVFPFPQASEKPREWDWRWSLLWIIAGSIFVIGDDKDGFRIVWAFLIAVHVWVFARGLWRWWRQRQASDLR
jgi:hypothetical protein